MTRQGTRIPNGRTRVADLPSPVIAGSVVPTAAAIAALRPLSAAGVHVTGGFWGERARINRERTIHHGYAELSSAGNLTNFRLAAGAPGRYLALGEPLGLVFPFLDSDVYKWLEAVGWELGRGPDARLSEEADEAIAAIAGAQRADGYINTYVQVVAGGDAYRDLAWGHELYTMGHLIQAAIAWHRALGDDRLLDIANRAVDSIERTFGPGGRDEIDGHPEIEMALVELYRTTGERQHLLLAARMIESRGHGRLGVGRFASAYWQDHEPVRDATTVAGHAVRQLYLDCGAVDVATELGDTALLEAVERRWRDMVATRAYLTGGVGSRHKDEAFGDPYELPPDQAYSETCAAIAGVMLAWRLLLATGRPEYADQIERTIYNGVLPGVSLDGTRFFYVNVLQRRTHRVAAEAHDGERASWFPCACCPPNLMRVLSSWEQQLATTDAAGIRIHQYADAELRADVAGGSVELAMEAAYPWDGRVVVRVVRTPPVPWTLSLRIPAWCRSWRATVGDDRIAPPAEDAGMVALARTWQAGDVVTLELDMPARITEPDPRVDAVRGCVALERGPLVYAIETADLPPGLELEEIALDDDAVPRIEGRPDVGPSVVGLSVATTRIAGGDGPNGGSQVGAVPYFAWANRGAAAMRVWIPRQDGDGAPHPGDGALQPADGAPHPADGDG